MLGNCEKMVLISSPPNEWPQIDDPKGSFNNNSNMASVAAATIRTGVGERVMDHKVSAIAQQDQQQQQNQEALRCPRCDSTNTKFCYYNNYSLTQPRHFCKACKRYWTRGGTLRSVPVGGGCRKNKRVKRPSINNNTCSTTSTCLTNNNNSTSLEASVNSSSAAAGGGCVGSGAGDGFSSGAQIHDLISSGSNHVNHHHPHHHPMFYGLAANSDINFPFPRYDLQNPHQINGLGLGFSSGLVHNMNSMNNNNNNNNNNNKQIFQDLISSNPLLSSNYNNTTSTTTTTTTTTTTPTISSLLASIKGGSNNNNHFQTLLPSYEDDLHMKGSGQNGHGGGMFSKDVKMEFEAPNRSMDHHHHHQWNTQAHQNVMDHQPSIVSPSDPSILWGNAGANLGAWLSPSDNNLGSSVPSLI